jgi:hypothetical protein
VAGTPTDPLDQAAFMGTSTIPMRVTYASADAVAVAKHILYKLSGGSTFRRLPHNDDYSHAATPPGLFGRAYTLIGSRDPTQPPTAEVPKSLRSDATAPMLERTDPVAIYGNLRPRKIIR